jgi:hypothetical protein
MTRAASPPELQRVRRSESMKRRATLKGSHDRSIAETKRPRRDHLMREVSESIIPSALASRAAVVVQWRAIERRCRTHGADGSVSRCEHASPGADRARAPGRAMVAVTPECTSPARAARRGCTSSIRCLISSSTRSLRIWSSDRSARRDALLSESWTRSERDVSVNESDGSRGTIRGARDGGGS